MSEPRFLPVDLAEEELAWIKWLLVRNGNPKSKRIAEKIKVNPKARRSVKDTKPRPYRTLPDHPPVGK